MPEGELGFNFFIFEISGTWYIFKRNEHSSNPSYYWKWVCWTSLVIQYRISLQTTSSELAAMRKNAELLSDCCLPAWRRQSRGIDWSPRSTGPWESKVISTNAPSHIPSPQFLLPSTAPKPRQAEIKTKSLILLHVRSFRWYVRSKLSLLLNSQGSTFTKSVYCYIQGHI